MRTRGDVEARGIEMLAELVGKTTGLDENQAKTVVYYALITHGMDKLEKAPVLMLYGPYGSGKSTLMDLLATLVCNPRALDGKVSKAGLRDALKPDTTALIDEADGIYERWFENRYSRKASHLEVKRERSTGWKQEPLFLFGATVLARRKPLREAAIQSRSVIVRTKYQADGVAPYRDDDFAGYRDVLQDLAAQVPWESVSGSQGSRIADTWAPLLCVATWLEDEAWEECARKQMEKASAELRLGQEDEPTEAVFQALLTLALEGGEGAPASDPKDRILIGDVKKRLADDGQKLTSWQVGGIVRELGLDARKAGGNLYVYTGGADKLRAAGRALGIQDDWLDEEVGA